MGQVNGYPEFVAPATISDYLLAVDASTSAGVAKIMFDGDSDKFLNGEGEIITIPSSAIGGLDAAISVNSSVTANSGARHSHSNSAILAATTASFLSGDKTKLDGIEDGATADQAASEVSFTPDGSISATNVQDAITEVRNEAGGSLIASGTATLGTSAISSGESAAVVTVLAPGVLTTDTIVCGFNSDPTSVTGYSPSTDGMLTIIPYPTAGNVNFKVCNNLASAVTPGEIVLNWRVSR